MNEKMKALEKYIISEIVYGHWGKKLDGCKWMYIVKYKLDDTLKLLQDHVDLVENFYTRAYEIN